MDVKPQTHSGENMAFRNDLLLTMSLILAACYSPVNSESSSTPKITFKDVSDSVGLKSVPTWKYGGPSVSDINNDGIYDFVLTNHHIEPAVLYYGQSDGTLKPHHSPIQKGDVHGIAPGDYDNDGDMDLLVSVGGGNGTTPSPPRLYNNRGGEFVDVTEKSGIAGLGARGRSVRWIDIDLDGDLDLLQIVARQLPGEEGPRNILFENISGGKFEHRQSPGFEEIEAERLLITDFNNDNISDLVLFEPLSLWQGNGTFVYENVTKSILPSGFDQHEFITAAADADFDNDGDRDLYLARGKTYYQIANNSIDFDSETTRIDIRDEGNESHDGMSFKAPGDVTLSRFWHWPRGVELNMPVFLGANQASVETPVEATIVTQKHAEGFPDEVTETGWYLGYLGNDEWRFEWRLNGNLAWDVRASLEGASEIMPDWTPQNYDRVEDVLLRNEGGVFTDASKLLPASTSGNHWGVTHGDFDNDGYEEFFVHRFGKLSKRVPDLLLSNDGGEGFSAITDHGAVSRSLESHGDMGAAFDYDLDGRIDILNGDDNAGQWHLYQNQTELSGNTNHLLVRIGYSENFIDPIGAVVTIDTDAGKRQMKDVGSAGAVHSQSLMSILHFGLNDASENLTVSVRWRDGTTKVFEGVKAGQLLEIGENL